MLVPLHDQVARLPLTTSPFILSRGLLQVRLSLSAKGPRLLKRLDIPVLWRKNIALRSPWRPLPL